MGLFALSRPARNRKLTGCEIPRLAVAALVVASLTGADPAFATPPLPKPNPFQSDAGSAAMPPLPQPKPRQAAAVHWQRMHLDAALERARRGDRQVLDRRGANAITPPLDQVLHWLVIQHPASRASFDEIAAFLDAHPFWPERQQLRMRAEDAMTDRVPLSRRLAWFRNNPAISTDGRLKHIEALSKAGHTDELAEMVRNTWLLATLSRNQVRDLLRQYGNLIDPELRWRRLDRLLWRGQLRAAESMLKFVDPQRQQLARARILLRRQASGVDRAIGRVPASLRGDPGLIYERARWRRKREMWDGAREMLQQAPVTPPFPKKWWKERALQIRHNLEFGQYHAAHALAASHRQQSGGPYAEAQWLAGWTALRFIDRPNLAKTFFVDMYQAVRTPISRGRAAYWAGRAAQAAGQEEEAATWFAEAGRYPTSYYGQLARRLPLQRADFPPEPDITGTAPAVPHAQNLMQIAAALTNLDQQRLAKQFLQALMASVTEPNDVAAAAAFARDLGFLEVSVETARRRARKGSVFFESGYPVLEIATTSRPEPALVHAIIRQESNFDIRARSRAGALGLMQLMPATARQVSRQLGIRYSKPGLTTRPVYNIRLGAHYLQQQIEAFDGSYPLAIAAYNAGPTRVRRWLRTYGDPRHHHVDLIDWIESIPVAETRNYVQRVLENLNIYRLRIVNRS